MNTKKYLPIGTVLTLKEGTKKIMITGFCCIAEDNKNKIYDYCGCLYPQGVVSSTSNLLFDHEQINIIHYFGYLDDEEKTFKEELTTIVDQIRNGDN